MANDLRRTKLGEPFVGFHYDFTFITAHGKSRFPGLYIWLADGEKLKVSIPKGHLLLQAGSQLEMMTGGYILSGYH
jgi:isopenicillin N synthase-like dioxygenase